MNYKDTIFPRIGNSIIPTSSYQVRQNILIILNYTIYRFERDELCKNYYVIYFFKNFIIIFEISIIFT